MRISAMVRGAGKGRESGLGPEPARMGPADQDLGRSDRPDAEQVKELRRHLSDQHEHLALKFFGLGLQSLDALGSGSQGPRGHAMLGVLCRAVSPLSTAGNLDRPLEFSQLGAELVRRGHDQRLELADRGGGGEDGSVAGGERDAQDLALATEPGLDRMFGGQGSSAARITSTMSVLRSPRTAGRLGRQTSTTCSPV
ncbi:hypothetical protein [Streptomyces werraensis]|uniref:hypothetical protein n=1 Tax=Streptomyces werraensis TaxID=68284 RepID=UPI00226B2755